MDIQLWVVIAIFSGSLIYMIRRVYRQMQGKKTAGCEKCDVVGKEQEKAVSK